MPIVDIIKTFSVLCQWFLEYWEHGLLFEVSSVYY